MQKVKVGLQPGRSRPGACEEGCVPSSVSRLGGANAGRQPEAAQHTQAHCLLTLKPGWVAVDRSSQTGAAASSPASSPQTSPALGFPSLGSAPPILPLFGAGVRGRGGDSRRSLDGCRAPSVVLPWPTALGGPDHPEHVFCQGRGLLRLTDTLHWPESPSFSENPSS